jgi:hypothetical protein
MAKPKHIKQAEALARKRKNLSVIREKWMKYQDGGEYFMITMAQAGMVQAEQEAREWDEKFTKAAAEAKCDRHGNPLNGMPFNSEVGGFVAMPSIWGDVFKDVTQESTLALIREANTLTDGRFSELFSPVHPDMTPEERSAAKLEWEKLKSMVLAEGGFKGKTLIAEMPLYPPPRVMTGFTDSIFPMPMADSLRFLTVQRGKRREENPNMPQPQYEFRDPSDWKDFGAPIRNHGAKGVIVSIDSDPPVDTHGNRIPDFIFEPAMPCQNMLDYMSGKIDIGEYNLKMEQKKEREKQLTSDWDPNIDGMAIMALTAGKLSEEQYMAIRARNDGPQPDFYLNDTLKAINVLDEDGAPCEGKLMWGEIVTMMDRSSMQRPVILVRRADGKEVLLEKKRFILNSRPSEEDALRDE